MKKIWFFYLKKYRTPTKIFEYVYLVIEYTICIQILCLILYTHYLLFQGKKYDFRTIKNLTYVYNLKSNSFSSRLFHPLGVKYWYFKTKMKFILLARVTLKMCSLKHVTKFQSIDSRLFKICAPNQYQK